jgi:predicted RNA-binding Zn ribbon-like protein
MGATTSSPGIHLELRIRAASAVDLLSVGELSRVKECPGPGDCGWLFYDTSRNGTRRWRSMDGCGSRQHGWLRQPGEDAPPVRPAQGIGGEL